MPSITKDSKGRSPFWICCYDTADGQRLKKTTKQKDRSKAWEFCLALERGERMAGEGTLTEQTARKILNEILERTGQGLEVHKVDTWFTKWLKDAADTAGPSTLDRYEQVSREFQQSLGRRAKLPLASITDDDIRTYRNSIMARGRAAKTANGAIKVLSAAFNRAVRVHAIATNPCTAVDPLPEDSAAREAFTNAQVRALVKAAESADWKLAILLAYHTGARLGDVMALTWSAVDAEAGLLTFTPSKTKKKIKVLKIPLHPELEEALLKSPGWGGQGPIFPTLVVQRVDGCRGLSAQFVGIMKRAGIEPKITQHTKTGRKNKNLSFHSLRHTFNSALANAGVLQELRMKLTGHRNKDVNDGYTHHELKPLRAAIALIPLIAGK